MNLDYEKIFKDFDKPEKEKRQKKLEGYSKIYDKVFTEHSLSTLYSLAERKIFRYIEFPISTGKEGVVFRAEDFNGNFLAIKIYKIETSNFKNMTRYILGDRRFENIKHTQKDIVFTWTQKEYKNLERLNSAKIRCPMPIAFTKNVLVMEFIGNSGKAAPAIKDIEVKNPEYIYDKIIEYIAKAVYVAKIVHADLSEFNILIEEIGGKQEPVIIDCGQAVLLSHPNASEFYERDIENISSYFNKLGIKKTPDQVKFDVKKWKDKLSPEEKTKKNKKS